MPLETCLGCYRQLLANNEYANTFADLAAQWRNFDRTARHWQALHPQHVYASVYEELVADPQSRIRELLAFCGLDFEPACLEFHKNARDVLTPSAAQVREPMRRDYGTQCALWRPPRSPAPGTRTAAICGLTFISFHQTKIFFRARP